MLRTILIGLGVLVLAVVGGAYLLPREVHVERSITVYASPEMIFPYINDYRAFNAWSPWADRDPDATYEFSGPPAGVGARMSWSGNDQVGVGSQEITVSEFPNHLETYLDFGAQGDAVAVFDLQPTDEGTEVTWGFDTDMGMNPIARYMGLMMDKYVGADYEQGLLNLRNLVEDETSVPRNPEGIPMEMPTMDAPDTDEMMETDEPDDGMGDDMDSGKPDDGMGDDMMDADKPEDGAAPATK